MRITVNQKKWTSRNDKIAIGCLVWNSCVPVAEQKIAIINACRIRFRYDGEFIWVLDTMCDDTANGQFGNASHHVIISDLIRRRDVKFLVFYSCQNACLDSKFWKKLVDQYFVQQKIRFLAIYERVNNYKDLVHYINAKQQGELLDSIWIRAYKTIKHHSCNLSPRQRQVLDLKNHGLTNDNIARQLRIREKYVVSLLRNIRNIMDTSAKLASENVQQGSRSMKCKYESH